MVGSGVDIEVTPVVEIGQRVRRDGHRGTILYVGNVDNTTGTWCGVDWDDPQRGKHDGTHQGKQYFKGRYPTSGSFVRPHQLDLGVSCPAAIEERYGLLERTAVDEADLAVAQKAMNAPFVELVGLDKVNKLQSQFCQLRQVVLDDCGVNGPGRPQELQTMCPKILELCLSRNLLPSWKSVADIAVQLACLEVLDVSGNRLTLPNIPEEHNVAFSLLEQLVAGSMDYTWEEVLLCCQMWPHIKLLHVPNNSFRVLSTPPGNILCQLRVLDLDSNPITDWAEINKLGKLPCLEILRVMDVGVEEVFFPTNSGEKTDLFLSLTNISLSHNNINMWQSVCELDKLQALIELKMTDNPLFLEDSLETCRQLVIARIGNLQKLNGMDIEATERKGAEYDYLKKYTQIWINLQNGHDQEQLNIFLKNHSRFPALVQKYGLPDMGELKTLPTTLKSKIISVELFCPDQAAQCFQKKLPRSMTIQKVMALAQKLFEMGSKFPRLAYISAKEPDVEFPLDLEFKTLDFFSVGDGDKISVRW